MSLSTNLISGLVSGFDWRTMIDQLIAIEHRRVDLVEDQKSEYQSKLSILQSINTKLLSFKTQAETLASSDAFNVFTSSLTTDSADYSASSFLSVSTSTSAAPGTHTIEMNANSQVARARQISSKSFTSYNTALGLSDGAEFVINGRAVKVEDTDDLMDIRDKINNLNTGTNATGVAASILTVSSGNYRLILTSDETGEDAFTIFDASSDTVDILQNSSTKPGLGFLDSTTPTIKNYISNGFQSEAFSSSTQAVGSMLGLSSAQDGSVTIGGVINIDINLAQDSLTDIAAEINTESTNQSKKVTASVVSTPENGVTTYRLKIENTTSYTDVDNVLQTLGLLKGDQGDVDEVHHGAEALYSDAEATTPIVAGTAWNAVRDSDGTLCDVVNDDEILIKGTKHDGTTVDTSFTILDITKAINDASNNFLEAIENAFGDVTAEIDAAGKIKITDDQTGDSQLSVTLVCQNEGGGTLDFGTISATTEGYTMETQAGLDANITIDGTAITSSSNIIDDVIAGVTLNLLTVEDLDSPNTTTVTLTISRDYDTIKSSVQTLLDQYNNVMSDINEQFAYDEETETAGLLQGDSTLSSIRSSLQNIVVSSITGLPSTMNALSLIGITSLVDYSDHKNDGKLTIDNDDFMDALEDNFSGLRRIFVAEGSTTDGDVQYITHTNDTVAGEYTVNIDTAATQANVSGSENLENGIDTDDKGIETITITQGSKIAAITLDNDSNGSSIDNIVNAINSELDTEYAQSITGNVKNTTSDLTTPITSSTTWDAVYSGGTSAGLATGTKYEIGFSGTKKNGTAVSGSYTIPTTGGTVQGLLSAIESAYGYEVSAGINTYGYLVVTDNTTGNSDLYIDITGPDGKSLDFGDVTTSNLVGSERNIHSVSGNAIVETDTWNDIDGHTLTGEETVYFSGHTVEGKAVEGSYTVALAAQLGVFLSAIEDAYGGTVDASIQDGRIVLTDGDSNSTLGIEIFEPSDGGVDFGTVSGGVTGRYSVDVTASKDAGNHLVLTHDDFGSSASFSISQSGADIGLGSVTDGVDVAGKINDEDATGSGQLLTGDAPESGQTTSVQGLVIKYTGTGTGEQGKVTITMGVGELFDRVLYDITNVADGYLDYRLESMANRIDDFEDRIEEMDARLNRKLETMINRFVAMELSLSRIQQQSNWLTSQINSSWSAWAW